MKKRKKNICGKTRASRGLPPRNRRRGGRQARRKKLQPTASVVITRGAANEKPKAPLPVTQSLPEKKAACPRPRKPGWWRRLIQGLTGRFMERRFGLA